MVDVTAPTVAGGQTSMHIQSLMPKQVANAVTSITDPTVIDSISLVRTSVAIPPPAVRRPT
jgi:hypothetical protein